MCVCLKQHTQVIRVKKKEKKSCMSNVMTESIWWHTGVLIKSSSTQYAPTTSQTTDPRARSINHFVFVQKVVFS